MKKIILSTVAILSSLIFLNSCSIDNNTTQPSQGAFLLVQASPTAPATVSVYVNDATTVFDTLNFDQYSPYISANPGTYQFMVDTFGVSSTTHKLSNTITIEANKYYSYFIIDSFSKVKSAFVNDVFKKPSGDSAYVRFFNFCPNSDALTLAQTGGAAFSAGRTFNDQQNNPQYIAFNEVKAGVYSFDLKNASGTVLKTQSITLNGSTVYTLFAKGTIGSTDTTKALSIGQMVNYPQ